MENPKRGNKVLKDHWFKSVDTSVCVPAQMFVCMQLSDAVPASCLTGPGASQEPGQLKGPESQHPPPGRTTTK